MSTAVSIKYDLDAAVHHVGTAHHGHYVVFVRDADDTWSRYNDTAVTTVTAEKVLTSGAYLLSYTNRRPCCRHLD